MSPSSSGPPVPSRPTETRGGPAFGTPLPPEGSQVGRYVVRGEIGRGGMGVVLEAVDPALDRPIALKLLTAGRDASDSQIRRFVNEARAASALRHPNIVSVFDAGESDGRFFFAMERIRGRSLGNLLLESEGRLPPRRVFEVALAVARALEHAHARGIVHRDVKPDNILLDEAGSALLTDFGLARDVRRAGEPLTETGCFVGTAAYASPEHLHGRAVDARSDLYSLGITVFEAVTGRRPFQESEGNLTQFFWRVDHDVPPSPRETRPELSPDVEAVCLKLLERNPERRYPNATSLAADLERFLRGERVEARPARVRRALGRLRRRWRAVSAVAVSVALGLASLASVVHARTLARLEAEERRRLALAELVGDLSTEDRLAALGRALAADPGYWEGHCERARLLRRLAAEHRRAGRLERAHEAALAARQEVAAATALDPNGPRDPLLVLDAEIARRQLRDPAATRAAYERLAARSENGATTYARARLAHEAGDASALGLARRALALAPALAPAHYLVAELELERGDPRAARAALDSLDGPWWIWDDPERFLLRARALERTGSADRALLDLDHALELDPHDAGARVERARVRLVLAASGAVTCPGGPRADDDAARTDVERALAIDPSHALGRILRVYLLARAGERANAHRELAELARRGLDLPAPAREALAGSLP